MAFREKAWELALEGEDLPPTTTMPELVRWVLPEELGYVLAECMTKAGIPMVGEPNGSLRYNGPDTTGQWSKALKARLANVTCFAQFTTDPRTQRPFTESTSEALWYYYRDYGIPCLNARGFESNSELPSKEEFVAAEAVWTFYKVDQDANNRMAVEDYEVCPEAPWKVLLDP